RRERGDRRRRRPRSSPRGARARVRGRATCARRRDRPPSRRAAFAPRGAGPSSEAKTAWWSSPPGRDVRRRGAQAIVTRAAGFRRRTVYRSEQRRECSYVEYSTCTAAGRQAHVHAPTTRGKVMSIRMTVGRHGWIVVAAATVMTLAAIAAADNRALETQD